MLDGAQELYQETILERGRQPLHGRRLDLFDADARGHNPLCGDRCHVFARVPAGRIEAIGFEARGCAISIASADLMAEAALGLDGAQVRQLADAVAGFVRGGGAPVPAVLRPLAGLHGYPSRIKCAMLPWHALLAALEGRQESIDG